MRTAAPSQETISTARVDAALVTANAPSSGSGPGPVPERADSSGNALVAMGTARTAYGTMNTAQANP